MIPNSETIDIFFITTLQLDDRESIMLHLRDSCESLTCSELFQVLVLQLQDSFFHRQLYAHYVKKGIDLRV